MITEEEIQIKLAEEIKLSGISQTKIAKAIGVTQQTVSEYLNGKSIPRNKRTVRHNALPFFTCIIIFSYERRYQQKLCNKNYDYIEPTCILRNVSSISPLLNNKSRQRKKAKTL